MGVARLQKGRRVTAAAENHATPTRSHHAYVMHLLAAPPSMQQTKLCG